MKNFLLGFMMFLHLLYLYKVLMRLILNQLKLGQIGHELCNKIQSIHHWDSLPVL